MTALTLCDRNKNEYMITKNVHHYILITPKVVNQLKNELVL